MLRRKRSERAPRVRRRRIRKLRLAVLLGVLAVLAVSSFTFGLVTAIASAIPALDPARQQRLEVNGYIYANDGHTVLAVLRGSEARVLVKPTDISFAMRHAIVDIEDKRFYEHRGIDVHGIARAVWADVRNKKAVQGGSTITQQFVKNAYVKNQRTIARKLKEAALAWQLEQRWTKDRILTAYLNTIYFGNGAYGIQQAALTYFGHGAKGLTLPESALLAGIPADPSQYDPVASPRAARERRRLVLEQMLAQGDITHADFLRASGAPLPRAQDVRLPGTQGPAQYFVNYVKQQLVDKYGSSCVFGGGLRVRTTIDLSLQQQARNAISKWLTDPKGPSAALVSIDPRTGRVVAMVGGNNYRLSQFNLAVQGERQPGSSFKPFVLATALEEGIAPATTFVSKPVLINLGDRYWSVHNYENSYLGPIDLKTATVESDNTVYAQLTHLVGPASIARTAHRLGISSPLKGYFAIGLGAEAVNPLEMARAFSTFANGGNRIDGQTFGNHPRAIVTVDHACGPNRSDENVPRPSRVISPRTDAFVNDILQGVVREGTGVHAALSDRPVAGKTGTTENYGDAWFVGYTPQLVTAVWVGYPNKLRPMLTEYHGRAVAGGTFPALIWKSFNETALRALHEPPEYFPAPPADYSSPERVVWRDGRTQRDNGNCSGALEVVYFSGTGPAEQANCKPNEVEVPRVVGSTITAAKLRLAAQPLTPTFVYKPAKPLQRTDIVLDQFPRRGRLSSYDKVTLVVAKPLDGRVPNVIGLSLRAARQKLRAVRLTTGDITFSDGPRGKIVGQTPPAGVAAVPGLALSLVVARG